ncbi:uncharacterized protein [Diabrotica undecimpunctata]|uniref:uncharacterized protein n=1 Tax=Diabrotica undecimpunctata TaxID=50387 RepID=UPI003B631BAA
MSTRSSLNCEILGTIIGVFNDPVLPTKCDILKCFLFIRNELKLTNNIKDPSIADASNVVATKVEQIWIKASIPTLSHKRIQDMIKNIYTEYQKLKRYTKTQQASNSYKEKICQFRNEYEKLFDIAACKCNMSGTLCECTCDKTKKVPQNERIFLQDQRSCRKMAIGPVQ